ncbi:hypothetical protein MSAN_01112100 [Mycena sanguinolenta]|uniref:Uncharacterized protein n=1 Tax=Mycena sanguinolenta TaxID=230812 RepID=A0A8H6YGK6_9AGAR|nr:hypothetical protein MSAN_01112100 [Mycena sanguinolenta]
MSANEEDPFEELRRTYGDNVPRMNLCSHREPELYPLVPYHGITAGEMVEASWVERFGLSSTPAGTANEQDSDCPASPAKDKEATVSQERDVLPRDSKDGSEDKRCPHTKIHTDVNVLSSLSFDGTFRLPPKSRSRKDIQVKSASELKREDWNDNMPELVPASD